MQLRSLMTLISLFVIAMFAQPVAAQFETPTTDTNPAANNKETVYSLVEALDAGDVDALDALLAEDFVDHRLTGDLDRAAYIDEALAYTDALEDMSREIEIVLQDGAWVAYRVIQTGTFENPLILPDGTTLAPTGESVYLPVHYFGRFDDDGQYVEQWTRFDNQSLMAQLGAIPVAGPVLESSFPDVESVEATNARRADYRAVMEKFTTWLFDDSVPAEAFDEIVAPDLAHHINDAPIGMDELLPLERVVVKGAMPNSKSEIVQFVVEGNWAAGLYLAGGDFTGMWTFPDGTVVEGQGQDMRASTIQFHYFDETGRFAGNWEAFDNLWLLDVMGLLPAE